jgi:predicted nucleic acid-binding protein
MLDVVSATAEPDQRARTADLLLEGFDMLSEDFDEERFYAAIRRAYWAAAEGSDRRATADLLIQRLEF